jgi:hypothetical protein
MHVNEAALVDYAMDRLAAVSGDLVLAPTHRIRAINLGEFEEDSRRLTVAVSAPDWSGVLAHELGHVEQFLDKRYAKAGDHQHRFDKYLAGQEVKPRALLSSVRYLQRMELDAERHAVCLIDRFALPVDRLRYIKSANAYVLAFEWARRHGRWPGSAWPLCHHRLITERDLGRLSPEVESAMGSKNPTPV